MTTIVFCHPWHGSFNKAILDTITSKLEEEKRDYQLIDLPKEKFNPMYEEAELSTYNNGKSNDPLVRKYQQILKKTTEIIFIFPIWWGTMPAILKGFFDRVMLPGFAFSYENGWTPLLDISKSLVITTSDSPTEMYKTSIQENFISMMLNSTGIKNGNWLNCDNIVKSGEKQRRDFLKKVENEL